MDLNIVSIRLITEKTLRDIFPAVTSTDSAAAIFQELIGGQDREMMALLTLNSAMQPINASIVSVGTLTLSLVHPREIFKTAILSNANSIIIAHNHPSNLVSPSMEDEMITRRIAEAGKLLGIELTDHLIIGDDAYYSFSKEYHGSFSEPQYEKPVAVKEPSVDSMQKRLDAIIAKKKEMQPLPKKEAIHQETHTYMDSR